MKVTASVPFVPAPVLILACGNPSRGDDALGPRLLERLQAWLEEEDLSAGFELIGDFQLQIEHALDLVGRRLALFIDAGSGTAAPFSLCELQASEATAHTSHALSPGRVLAVSAQAGLPPPPPSFVLCVRGESFELGEGLSFSASAHEEAAFGILQALCRQPSPAAWRALADEAVYSFGMRIS